MEAKRRGAKVIHVDPRYTRTSAVADVVVPLRAGTDIAFLGGLIHHVIVNGHYFEEYVLNYTNASTIISERFRDTEDLDGLFSGWDPSTGQYDVHCWSYEGVATVPAAGHKEEVAEPGAGETEHEPDLRGERIPRAEKDPTLRHPRCVFQILARHFSRYTPRIVSEICGIDEDLFHEVAQLIVESSGRERTTAFAYSVGWTQLSVGVQYIRAAAILQLLLGNIGRPGGGILALRGHASIQGSTDIPTLYDLLPGYMPMPFAHQAEKLESYFRAHQSGAGWWHNLPKYMVSLLKAWFGEHATAQNDFCFHYLPNVTGNHSHMNTVADMADGKVKGYLVVGENPVVGSVNAALQRKGLRQLEWLVVRDFAPTETAEFWRTSAEHERGEVRAEDIETEVFFFPCAAHSEKDGTFTNAHRLVQWHDAAIEPPGDARSELWFYDRLAKRLRAIYADTHLDRDRPIVELTWDYPDKNEKEGPDAEAVLQEIHGRNLETGELVTNFQDLKDDGTTACGCWLYSGVFADGVNQAARKKPGTEQNWVAAEWGWAWPDNRRILYSRASADPKGRPWSLRKRYVWWDHDAEQWTGLDRPDFIPDRPPDYRPDPDATGTDTIAGNEPFIMQADGRAWLYAPSGLLDGPLPTHYEPQESVLKNPLYGQQCNPRRLEWRRSDNRYHRPYDDPQHPFVLTTYRIAEHHTAGGMSRWLSWLSELAPEMFCEVSPELARLRGLDNGGWATIATARGEIECRVLVTRRLTPLEIGGKTIHQIGVPYHWGRIGRTTGDPANELLSFNGDPNVSIQDSKALTADIRPGRRRRDAPSNLVRRGERPEDAMLRGRGQPEDHPPEYKD
jgi:formate dehydrogenase major subunit